MTLSPARGAAPRARFDRAVRLLAVTVLGFASGLPLALTGQAMQAWLSVEGIDIATIGFLSLVGLPYTFKFLWAPLMDRFELPLARPAPRLAGADASWRWPAALFWMAATPPASALARVRAAGLPGGLHLGLAGRRHRRLPHRPAARARARHRLVAERARLPAGDDPVGRHRLIWADPRQGGGWTWPEVYRLMAWLMVGAAVLSALLLPQAGRCRRGRRAWRATTCSASSRSLAAVGRRLPRSPTASRRRWRARCWRRCSRAGADAAPLQARWTDLVALLLGIAFTLPLAAWAARRARFETLLGGLSSYFSAAGRGAPSSPSSCSTSCGDAFAGSLMTPFLLQAMAFSTGRGRRRQQGDRPVADDRRRAARRRADAPARAVARAAAVRRAADAQQPRLLVAGGQRPGAAARADDAAVRLGLRQAAPSRRRSTAAC